MIGHQTSTFQRLLWPPRRAPEPHRGREPKRWPQAGGGAGEGGARREAGAVERVRRVVGSKS